MEVCRMMFFISRTQPSSTSDHPTRATQVWPRAIHFFANGAEVRAV